MQQRKQMSETFQVGIILACVGGFLDAYTYICRGGVFANAQTGNIVLLGINIAQRNIKGGIRCLIPILAFAAGVIIAEMIRKRFKEASKLHWRQIIVVCEIFILAGVSFLPQSNKYNNIANIIVSFVCSLQVQSFRKMNGKTFATTMCTGNLRSATEHLFKWFNKKDKRSLQYSLQYFGIIAFFIVGTILGAIFAINFGAKSLLFACVGLIAVFGLMFKEHL